MLLEQIRRCGFPIFVRECGTGLPLVWAFWIVAALSSAVPSTVLAIPEFARKYETSCSSCHTPTFPELNANGRRFQENGFRRSAEEEERLTEDRRTDPESAPPMALLQELPLTLRIQSSIEIPWSPEDSDRNTVDFHCSRTSTS